MSNNITMSEVNYNQLTDKELRHLCKVNNIDGYSRMKKTEIIDLLTNKINKYPPAVSSGAVWPANG